MSPTDCAHGLGAGAWVLGALPDDEATAYTMHLRTCEACRAEVARLQSVVDVLPMAAEQVDPPPELRARVLGIVREEAARASRATETARPWWRWSPRWAAAVAAACLGLGIVAGVVLRDGGGPGARTVAVAGVTGNLVVDGEHARLHLADMRPPPRGQVYQVWKQRPGRAPEPTDALFTVRRDGSATVEVPGGVRGVERVLVTAEPDGGSEVPTSAPILSATPA